MPGGAAHREAKPLFCSASSTFLVQTDLMRVAAHYRALLNFHPILIGTSSPGNTSDRGANQMIANRFEGTFTPTRHVDRIYAIAEGQAAPAAAYDEVSTSWQRCVKEYRIDPTSQEQPQILAGTELAELREPLARLIVGAQDELDGLYKVVGQAGYVVLLCNQKGVAIDHRGGQMDADQFKYWGNWLGGTWSEEVEGTNGIGTCIAEERPITVHRDQHLRVRHTNLSCSAAPIFDGSGNLMAVLDVSSIDPALSERSHALTGALTQASARGIEERIFREQFRRNWVVAIAVPDGSLMLLAVDQDQRIVGADRNARTMLLRDDDDLPEGLWALFERDHTLFRHKDRGDLSVRLMRVETAEHWPALITPPASDSRAQYSPEYADMHVRPRLGTIARRGDIAPARPARGGLPPGALRRVHEYVQSHLEENISLETLARTSGLSIFHFTRVFKQSQGVTPHHYLIQRRVERARELLSHTDLSMSEIAFATGFSDPSHFARRFRELVGVPPSTFKWTNR
jgi:AraC-like DNA-binding protein